ncbi:TnsA endonuclease N-terminal domain-containing protein [Variovorax sp. LG9.2]|uniref:TnsA endonuclease N-terminal domain-containing protein n=1 Tax=Variovorax sp. LG9.2 TaxID=3048626 RepID=UPI002B22507D|nr:TnsA endonuclease N-terminal domain-containing protein [Variovorax sp. LG9.2]MEB0056723.1 hypothetical protein [Variovorax sp. LG9.2]
MKTDRYLFKPVNRSRYTGDLSYLRARSSWEITFMEHLDLHPAVMCWNYEPFFIPYLNPLWPDRVSKYLPDFWVECSGRGGEEMKFIVEIKPAKHLVLAATAGQDERFRYIVNQAKFKAARSFAVQQGATFRILTR